MHIAVYVNHSTHDTLYWTQSGNNRDGSWPDTIVEVVAELNVLVALSQVWMKWCCRAGDCWCCSGACCWLLNWAAPVRARTTMTTTTSSLPMMLPATTTSTTTQHGFQGDGFAGICNSGCWRSSTMLRHEAQWAERRRRLAETEPTLDAVRSTRTYRGGAEVEAVAAGGVAVAAAFPRLWHQTSQQPSPLLLSSGHRHPLSLSSATPSTLWLGIQRFHGTPRSRKTGSEAGTYYWKRSVRTVMIWWYCCPATGLSSSAISASAVCKSTHFNSERNCEHMSKQESN